MTVQTMTLHVPDVLYLRLKQRAEQTKRSVEAEALDVLAGAMPVADELPADLEASLSPLTVLDDASLERAARSRLPHETNAALEELHLKQQREELSEAERQTLDGLVRQYERNLLVRAQAAALLKHIAENLADMDGDLLVRAQAAALLKQRGHDISSLLRQL